MGLENAQFVALPVAILVGGAFIVELFTFCQSDFDFYPAFFPVQGQRDQSVALAFDMADQPVQFTAVEQQFTRSRGFRMNVGGGGWQGGDVAAEKERFTLFDDDVALAELDSSGPEALDLPSLQCNTGFIAILNEIFVLRFLVEGDG